MEFVISSNLDIDKKSCKAIITTSLNKQVFIYKTKINSANELCEFTADVMGKNHPSNGFLFSDIKREFSMLDDDDITDIVVGVVMNLMS